MPSPRRRATWAAWYDFSGIGNTSTVSLSSFYWRGTPPGGKPIEGVYLAGVIVGGRHANCYMTPMGGMNHGFDVTFGKCAAEFLTEDNQ